MCLKFSKIKDADGNGTMVMLNSFFIYLIIHL